MSMIQTPTGERHLPDEDYKSRIDNEWGLATNWLDETASFTFKRFPPIAVTKVLGSTTIFNIGTPAQQNKHLVDISKVALQSYEDAKAATVKGNVDPTVLDQVHATTTQQQKRKLSDNMSNM